MPDTHWEKLKDIFQAALELPPQERGAYLELASNGDTALRQAVESLLKSHEETDNFIDSPAYKAAADMLVDATNLATNQTIAHYRIISLLGEGGMGKVYLAEDTKLHRQVALKFLASSLTENQDRLQRFEREARAASFLNHPNILTIHEIGESQSHRFIATEFIQGETLREKLNAGINTEDALEIAIQITSALVAVHRVGIVHRDIKPENIMIRRDDGLVKVLDFGLAKMAAGPSIERAKSVDAEAPTQYKTGPGVVIGTVAYMSPEQARGESVDAQTDIWSLGVILFEMIAGTSPFIASSSNEIISAILSKTPAPSLSLSGQELADGVEEIVAKALAKSKDQRYQTTRDLLVDLKRAKQLAQDSTNDRSQKSTGLRSEANETGSGITANTRPVSSAQYIANQVKVHRRGALALAVLVLMAVLSVMAVHEWRIRHTAAATTPPPIKSLAILPLKSLDSGENYVGVGIADAVIRRISQTGQLTVRPTSAVLRYVKEDTDSLTAARQLNTDAILEGTVQRSGDRLRVTVNLLRTSDGSSLYADNFDLTTADVFSIQDRVAQQVASRLKVSFEDHQKVNERYPTDPRAYEYYIRGVTSLDERGYEEAMPQMQTTIDWFKKSIAIDPTYVLSHSKLAFAYAWTGAAIEPGNSSHWTDLSKEQIKQAEALDPNVAETHIAHAYLLWTASEGYQTEAAIRELLLAKQLNPNTCSPDLPAMLGHMGFEDLASRELERALNIDPTSQSLKELRVILPYLRADADKWFTARQQFLPANSFTRVQPWYYIRKGLLDDAQKSIEERRPKAPDDPELLLLQALVLALRNKPFETAATVPEILAKIEPHNQSRHHQTYSAACIYAVAGNAVEAVKWLKETANTGFPNYPLFERDPFLDRIRKSPEFIQFMSDQKAQWDRLRAEFVS